MRQHLDPARVAILVFTRDEPTPGERSHLDACAECQRGYERLLAHDDQVLFEEEFLGVCSVCRRKRCRCDEE